MSRPVRPYEGDIKALAAKYRKYFKWLQRGSQVPEVRAFLEGGLRSLGGKVVIDEELWSFQGLVGHGEHFDVVVSSVSSLHRDNFTIAHNIGHWLMHCGEGFDGHFRCKEPAIEAQADDFALGLLVPGEELWAYIKKARGNIYAIAGHFGVPTNVIALALGAVPRPRL